MRLSGGENVEISGDTLIVRFPGKRCVLSTSWLNGGYREDLTSVFNHQIPLSLCNDSHLARFEPVPYLRETASGRGIDPETTAGLLTRAAMQNAAVITESFRDISVSAVVTAGVDVNGGRAGDPASYYECNGVVGPVGGTINTILAINAAMPEYAMVRALITATEAKAAALQQVMAKSCYSSGIATGSGTDMSAIITNPESPVRLTDAGKHAKIGELIGRVLIRATQEALQRETGLDPDMQRNILARFSRYSVNGEVLWERASGLRGLSEREPERQEFLAHLDKWSRDPVAVAITAASLHLIDEVQWGLLPEPAARAAIWRITGHGFADISGTGDSSDHFGNTAGSGTESLLAILEDSVAGSVLQDRKTAPDPAATSHGTFGFVCNNPKKNDR